MTDPTLADFKSYFSRDFPFGTDPATQITDDDLNKALGDTQVTLNPDGFSDQLSYTRGFLLLWAHTLVTNLQMSAQGASGGYSFLYGSKSVGSVSVSLQIPGYVLDNPLVGALSRTNYGVQYLNMIWNNLRGNMFVVEGATQA